MCCGNMSTNSFPIPSTRGDNPRLMRNKVIRNYKNARNPSVFSDEELDDLNASSAPSREKLNYSPELRSSGNKLRENGGYKGPSNIPPGLEENDDVEQELDMFNKAIHISNIDEIDHVGLMRGMHERFQRKQVKWQQYASHYSKWAFGINFLILIMQIIQMLFHQLVDVFNHDTNQTQQDIDSSNQYNFASVGFNRRYGFSVPDLSTTFSYLVFNSSTLQAIRCCLAAFTAVLAGLQMKLKLTEKAEKYRRGAKVYARLHRLSTYYLMLAENGGKVEDVTGLWREAMKREGKKIPVVKTFMAT